MALPAEGQAPLDVSAAPRFQLVGFTRATAQGHQRVFGFTRTCAAEFPRSRMCTSQEVLDTVSLPRSLQGDAWVRPVLTGDWEVSGAPAAAVQSCAGWTSLRGEDRGWTVDASGAFESRSCGAFRRVACCASIP